MEIQELIQAHERNFQIYQRLLSQIDPSTSAEKVEHISLAVKSLLFTVNTVHEEVINFRLKKILSEEHPYIPKIHVKRLNVNPEHNGMTVHEMIANFLRLRRSLLDIFKGLSATDWHRKGLHEQEGHVTFYEFTRRMAEKDEALLQKLQQLFAHIDIT